MTSSELNAEFKWHVLHCHPSFTHHQIKQVQVGIRRYKNAVALCYEITGNLNSIKIPAQESGARHDELWRRSCAELFITAEQSAEYVEFNFSPSSQWAAYSFSSYRQGMVPLHSDPPVIMQEQSNATLRIVVNMLLPAHYHERMLHVGLCMVIENSDGPCSYWALQHDSPRPDFHRRENWLCLLSI